MWNTIKSWFVKEPVVEPAPIPSVSLQAAPIHINISNIGSLERNKARVTRLRRAIEVGKGTPEIEAELAARTEQLRKLAEELKL